MLLNILGFLLRLGELATASIVAGITGNYLYADRRTSTRHHGRFIYTEVIAALSILLGFVWLLPFASGFLLWPADLMVSYGWFVAFGLLLNFFHRSSSACGNVWKGDGNGNVNGNCQKWRADIAFCFLAAICWLASAYLGMYWARRRRRNNSRVQMVDNGPMANGQQQQHHGRRHWFGSRV